MNQEHIRKPIKLVALLAGAALLGMVTQSALAVGTASGTTIANLAKLSYSVGGTAQNEICSSTAGNTTGNGGTTGTTCTSGTNGALSTTFVVDNKVNVTVAEGNTTFTTVVPGQTNAVTTFTVTNNGNTAQDYALTAADVAAGQTLFGLTDSFVTSNIRVFVDANANGVYDAATDTATFIDELAANSSRTVFVVVDIPAAQANGDDAIVSLTATTRNAGAAGLGAVTNQTVGANTAGVDVVFATAAGTDTAALSGSHSARDAYSVVSAVISVAKTATLLCDPLNGITNPKNIPGAIVQWTVTIHNGGAAPATLSTITDTLDANTTHDPGLRAPTNAATCIPGAGTNGFRIASSVGTRPVFGGTGSATLTNAADTDGATIAGQNVTITYTNALPAGSGYAAGELKPGEDAIITFNVLIN